LGTTTVDDSTSSAVHPDGLDGVRIATIDAGSQFKVALDTDGVVWTWGGETVSELGRGERSTRPRLRAITTFDGQTPPRVLSMRRATAEPLLSTTKDGCGVGAKALTSSSGPTVRTPASSGTPRLRRARSFLSL
jgi:hypothetical protein